MKLLCKGSLTTCLTTYYNNFVNKTTDGHQQVSGEWVQCDVCTGTDCWCYVERMDNKKLHELDVNMSANN